MANYTVHYVFTLRDVDGQQSNVTISGGPSGDTNTLAALATNSDSINTVLAPITNAKVVRRSLMVLIDAAQGNGVDSPFPDIEQRASMVFTNNKGSKMQIHIPAPKDAIFLAPPADDIVDVANADVAAFATAVEAVARDQGATALNLFQGGSLSERRRSKRLSIHV